MPLKIKLNFIAFFLLACQAVVRFSTAIEVGQFAKADYFVANRCSF
ncbi:hypothetical protein AC45_4095 [Escherichia coli 2-210-07_S3_C3]|nr:hypothetical protein AC45_4095 [Escherichia coli 2-210-07_S3_C3]